MNQITPEQIKGCLQSMNNYKINSKSIKKAVIDNNIDLFEPICFQISQALLDHRALSINKLLALRLSKDLIDVFNPQFTENFGTQALKSFKMYAEFNKQSEDPNRGISLFSGNHIILEKEELALDCIRAWAMFFPLTPSGQQSVFFEFYQELLREGVHFLPWAYYKEEFISQHKDSQYDRIVEQMKTQQIRVADQPQKDHDQEQNQNIPTPEVEVAPIDPREKKIFENAKQVILQCNSIKDKVEEKCYIFGDKQYIMHMFDEMKTESEGISPQLEDIVLKLFEKDELNNLKLADEIMDLVEYLEYLIQDIRQLNSNKIQYPQFRKKYLGKYLDLEEQQQFEQQQQQQQEALGSQQALEKQQEMEKQYEIEQQTDLDKQREIAEQQEREKQSKN